MWYWVAFAGGVAVGAWIVYFIFSKRLSASKQRGDVEIARLNQAVGSLNERLGAATMEVNSSKQAMAKYRQEDAILKREIMAMDVRLHKVQAEELERKALQVDLDRRSQELAEKYLSEVEKWVGQSINANNYAACKQRLSKAIDWCRSIGFDVSQARENSLHQELKNEYELAVRAAIEREEQARIKARIREEQQREREAQRIIESAEREKAAIEAALDKALAKAKSEHSAEVEQLRAKLAEAEERSKRAIAQAQLTKAGHIYVISNIGSFGENVFKIGMTRRLEPMDRINELGDASVPFPFDVHMMISCEDAPSLENTLHKAFHMQRINKINPRKEYFRVTLDAIRDVVVKHSGEVAYTADAEALQYRQSITMTEEDQREVEEAFEKAEAALGVPESEE